MKTHLSERLPFEIWPEKDRRAWSAAIQEKDPLEVGEGGAAAKWREVSQRSVERGYGRWLTWLDLLGELDHTLSPASRATRERVRAYRDELVALGYAEFTVAGRIRHLADALRVMDPGVDTSFIRRGARRLLKDGTRANPLVNRMRPSREIYRFGLSLMEDSGGDPPWTKRRAEDFRDGLLIALWASRPLRVSNLAGINIDTELVQRASVTRLEFDAKQMKANRPLECHWPGALVTYLDIYLRSARPVLMGEYYNGPALWVSSRGRAMSASAAAHIIRKRTKTEFEVVLNPHLMRHIVATEIAENRPKDVVDIVSILGHSTLAISERHYNQAGPFRAAQAFDAVLLAGK